MKKPLAFPLAIVILIMLLRAALPAAAQDVNSAGEVIFLPVIMNNPLPPNAPVLAVITGAEDGTYSLYWTLPPGRITEYAVQEATDVNFTQNVRVACSGPTRGCEVSRRPAGTYYYRVRAANLVGVSPWSNIRSVTVELPSTPHLSLLEAADWDRNYRLSWTSSTLTTAYRLQQSPDNSFSNPVTLYFGPDQTFQVINQANGGYYYRVRAEGPTGSSPWSNLVSMAVVPPETPTLYPINNNDFDRAYTVTWSAVPRATGYILEQSNHPSFTGWITAYSGPGTSWSINPQARGAYYYRVRAVNGIGSSGNSVVQSVIVEVPDRPVINAINNSDQDRAYTVSWQSSARALTYQLEQSTVSNFSSISIVYNGSGTSWSINPQARGTYYYRVRAFNPVGASNYSAIQTITIDVPATPTLGAISNPEGDGSYTVAWASAARAVTYRLEESTSSTFASPRVVYTGTGTRWDAAGKANAVYYYRVRAENPIGASSWSAVQSVRVGLIAPVLQPIENADNNNFYRLNWNAVPNATGYVVEEASNSAFTGARVVYEGGNTTWLAADRPTFGLLYYRVKGVRSGSQGDWSNVRSVNIALPPSGVTVMNNHGAYKTSPTSGFLRVVGEIYNNTTTPINGVYVTVRFYWGGSQIATDTEKIQIDIVHPGEKAPFMIIMSDPGSYDRYDFAPVSYGFTSARRPNVTIRNVSVYTRFDDLQIEGEVVNNDSVTAAEVSAHFILFDETGKIMDTPYTASISTSGNILAPGQSATFIASSAYPDFSRLVYIRYHTDARQQ